MGREETLTSTFCICISFCSVPCATPGGARPTPPTCSRLPPAPPAWPGPLRPLVLFPPSLSFLTPGRLAPSSHSPLEFSSLIQCWFPAPTGDSRQGRMNFPQKGGCLPFHMGALPTQPPYLAAYPWERAAGQRRGQCLESGSNGGTPGPWKW